MPAELDRNIPLVDAILRIIEGDADEMKAVEILLNAESEHGVSLVLPAVVGIPEAPEELYNTLIQGNFFAFLSETHLVFSHASEYDKISLLLPGGLTWSATWRAWGATLAEWANQDRWGGKSDWCYWDFYAGIVDEYIHGIEAWQDTVMRVIETKCKLVDASAEAH